MTRDDLDALVVTWQPPDIPNGNVTLYTLRAVAVETHASNALPPVESQIQGGASNSTILRGLQPGTKYNLSITASNAQGPSDPAYTVAWTAIGPPDKPVAPKVLERGDGTVTVALTEGHSEYGPISAYQVVVVQAGAIPPVGPDIEYLNYDGASKRGLNYYVTAQLDPSEFHRYRRFTVGDGKLIGGYYNAPLKDHLVSAQVGLAVISRVQAEIQRSYSDLAGNTFNRDTMAAGREANLTALVLGVAIAILGALLAASILLYFVLRRRHARFHMRKLPEQQELTLQGPMYEVDNMGYIPEDVPERVNHYQELKKKVWCIPQNDLFVDSSTSVRRGRFGTVHTGTVLKDDVSCPVTVHVIADRALRASDKRHMLRELDVCIRAGTMKHLAGLVGTCETPDTLYVVHELLPYTLKGRLLGARSGDLFPVDRMLSMSSSIATALQYLADHQIVHTYLCARSVGLSYDWTPKLMGHGIAKYALEDIKYIRWTAIECLGNQGKKQQQSGVIWAFGVLLWEMFSMGGTPYSDLIFDSEVEDAVKRGVRLPQLMDTPDPVYAVMSCCWHHDPEERPTYDELTRMVRKMSFTRETLLKEDLPAVILI